MQHLSTSSYGIYQNQCSVLCLPNQTFECKSHTSVIFKKHWTKYSDKEQQKYVDHGVGACCRARPSALSVAAQAEFSHHAASKQEPCFSRCCRFLKLKRCFDFLPVPLTPKELLWITAQQSRVLAPVTPRPQIFHLKAGKSSLASLGCHQRSCEVVGKMRDWIWVPCARLLWRWTVSV